MKDVKPVHEEFINRNQKAPEYAAKNVSKVLLLPEVVTLLQSFVFKLCSIDSISAKTGMNKFPCAKGMFT